MSTVVIMPGGFHPFHAGHYELYKSALEKFPGADVYVAASNDTSERPFPFSIKEKLAKVAGIPPGRFVQVKSPFSAEEITKKYDPNKTVLIFVKSEKNAKNGSDPEGPFPAEIDPKTGKLPLVTRGARKGQPVSTRLQYYKGNEDKLQPMSRNSYLAYLPTVEFGPGIKSGSELRNMWPKLNDRRKTAFVMSMYPATQNNLKLAQVVVKMIDAGMGDQQGVAESSLNEFAQTDGEDKKSYLLKLAADLATAMYGPNKNNQEVKDISRKIMTAGGEVKIIWNDDSTFNVVMYHPVYFKQGYLIRLVGRGDQGVTEGEVIPFARKPQPKLTWQQVPKDVLLLANEWYWADDEDGSLDAVLDPKGYGSGTRNDVQYIAAQLQQRGWAIEHDLDDNTPGEFNMKLTNKNGQSVLLPWEDAQDFKGWAAGTRPSMREGDENQYRRPSSSEVARVSRQIQTRSNPTASKFMWKKPNQISGSFTEPELLTKGFKKSQYNAWGGTQQMWDRLLSVKEDNLPEDTDYLEEK